MLQVWIDGDLVPADAARVSVYDRGFRSGEGVFETLRAYGDHPFRLDAHAARAVSGARFVGFELEPERLRAAVTATAGANLAAFGGDDSVVRLTATPGRLDPDTPFPGSGDGPPTLVVTSHRLALPAQLYRRGVTATAVPWSRELPSVKAVSYLAATVAGRHARAQGADEALLTDAHGHILEGANANLFLVHDGRLLTPPADAGILAGVTRGVVLEVARAEGYEVEERPVTVSELRTADEAFLTATTRELVPLVRFADDPVGDGVPGPATAALHEAYRAEVRREVAARPDH